MKRSILLAVALFVAALPVIAAPLVLKTGQPFIKASKQIHAAGWRADPLAHLSTGEYMGVERQLIEAGYAEVDACSEGRTFCIHQYTKGNACLRLQTQGEQIRWMKVDRWSNECSERGVNEDEHATPAELRYLLQWRNDCELAGECKRTQIFLQKLKHKYAQDPVIMQRLQSLQIVDGER